MKKIPIILLSTLILNTSQLAPLKETLIGADFSSGVYAYQLMDKFYQSPDTIEAWVRLGFLANGEAGGVIFGNTFMNNLGPKIRLHLNLFGDVMSNLETEVKPYGINNAYVEVRIHLTVTARIVLPFISVLALKTTLPLPVL